jgi:hypothetical protein
VHETAAGGEMLGRRHTVSVWSDEGALPLSPLPCQSLALSRNTSGRLGAHRWRL